MWKVAEGAGWQAHSRGGGVTTIKSKVTLIEGHRTAKLGVLKIIFGFKEFHLSNNVTQVTGHNVVLRVTES